MILNTTAGDLDIELWPKEAPKVGTQALLTRLSGLARQGLLCVAAAQPHCKQAAPGQPQSCWVAVHSKQGAVAHHSLCLNIAPAAAAACQCHTTSACWTQTASPAAGPQAVRNFVQLCLEGYYDGCVFHRMIPDFLVQTGDPSGTGLGGESAFGAPFKDEFHSRLKFSRRWGLMWGQHPAWESCPCHVQHLCHKNPDSTLGCCLSTTMRMSWGAAMWAKNALERADRQTGHIPQQQPELLPVTGYTGAGALFNRGDCETSSPDADTSRADQASTTAWNPGSLLSRHGHKRS